MTTLEAREVEELREEREVSLTDMVAPLRRRWRFVVGIPLALAILTAIVSLLLPSEYTARTTFTPESQSASRVPSSLVGLAGQLGFPGTLGNSVSPDFFADLLSSRELLTSTLRTEFPDFRHPEAQPRPLLELLRLKGNSEADRLESGVRYLHRQARASVDRRTGIVALTVELRSAPLSAAVANRMIELLNKFNLEQRQTQSREQRRFTGERLKEAESDLRGAEAQLLRFMQANRTYESSPYLSYEATRLQRQVTIKQEAYLTLNNAFQEARIAEVRDTPVLTVIDTAVVPARRSFPKRTLMVLMAAVLGLVLGIGAAIAADYRVKVRTRGRLV
jgi:uncharacterized protein involved in exopolysaccharide biosynthesis